MHDDDEGEDQDVLAHADLHREQRPEQRAGDRAERRADREHEREQRADVDAHGFRHLAVRRAGAHQHADARSRHQQTEEAAPSPGRRR